ncbi:MAG: MurR/RpiR family transcriptional regulator [Rhodospirillales bacterium]|nr:MurR/RpiR family transcriptional regulator [Rhodospirillales bacterium]
MNDTIVPISDKVVDRLLDGLPSMSPQLRKAARYVLDNQHEVGMTSIRGLAESAKVKPNTLVRMAQAVGFDGFDDFRAPFRQALRARREDFPDKARWLQEVAQSCRHGRLLGEMAAAAFDNVQELYTSFTADQVKGAADAIVAAKTTYVLGVGVGYSLAHNFSYLAGMALDRVIAIPQDGSLPIDGITRAGPEDVLLAMTFQPFRREVVDAVEFAAGRGLTVIGLSDTISSPILSHADHAFCIPTDSPQFFTSTVATSAFLETLMAFVIAEADAEAIDRIQQFHSRRREVGVYWSEDD